MTEINISDDNVFGECELKCTYNYKYVNSNCVATNNGVMLLLSYDKTSTHPVTYNNNKYDVGQITIYSPSFHKFNGDFMDAEMIITHNPIMGGAELAVAIPIIESNMSNDATHILTQIILNVSNSAPNNGESTTVSLSNYSLDNFVPQKPFYNYSDTANNIEYIVFDKEYSINLSQQTLNTLRSIIGNYNSSAYGGNLFYNKKGPNSSSSAEGDIYISCQPTGNSEENTDVMYDKPSISVDVLSSPIFKVLMIALIFIISFYVIHLLILFLSIKMKKKM